MRICDIDEGRGDHMTKRIVNHGKVQFLLMLLFSVPQLNPTYCLLATLTDFRNQCDPKYAS